MRNRLLACLACTALLAGDREDLPYLVAALDSPNPVLVEDAQHRLLIAGPEALPLLISAAEDELARRADLVPRVERLVRELDADEYETRERAQLDLVEVGQEALPALREAAAHGTPEQQARAQAAVDKIGAGAAVPPRFLVQIARALAAQPDDRCIPSLVALARQPDVPVMFDALQGLWLLGTEDAVEALRAMAEDASVERRWLARAALLESGVDLDLSSAGFVSDWPSALTRDVLYAALRRWESPNVVRFALDATIKEDASASGALLDILEQIVDAPLLSREALRVLQTQPQWNRGLLVRLLRDPTQEASAALTAALADADWQARDAAVTMLARLKGEDAARLIEPLLRDPEPPVRLAALRALHAVGGGDPRPFREALDDPVLANEAIEYALVRMPGAEQIASIEDRSDGPSDEEGAMIERWLQAVLDPVFSQPLREWEDGRRVPERAPVRLYLLTAARNLQGPLPPRPIDVQGPTSRFRDFLRLAPADRSEAIRSGLDDMDEGVRAEAVRWAVWEGCDGLEEDVLPLLSCQDDAAEEMARLYLLGRRTAGLAARVARMAQRAAPGSAALLWVQWEGRAAVKALLDRLKEPGPIPPGLLRALAQGPLEPTDAPLLLPLLIGGGADARGMCSALRKTASREAADRLGELATMKLGPSLEAWTELAADPAQHEFVLRYLRSFRGIVGESFLPDSRIAEAIRSPQAVDELSIRVPMARWSETESLARAIVLCDSSAARRMATEWNRSIHVPRRLAALWIDVLTGEPPSRETIEVLASGDSVDRLALLEAARESGTDPLLRACTPLLADPDPNVGISAWHALAAGVGTAPEGHANAFAIPFEARRAWVAWFERNLGADRRQLLEERVAALGAPEGDEGLLHAFVHGPSHVSLAAWILHGSRADDMPTTSQSFVDEAVKWRNSLR